MGVALGSFVGPDPALFIPAGGHFSTYGRMGPEHHDGNGPFLVGFTFGIGVESYTEFI